MGHVNPYTPHKAHDEMMQKHHATWTGITKMMLWSTVAIVIILALMAVFLVKRTVA